MADFLIKALPPDRDRRDICRIVIELPEKYFAKIDDFKSDIRYATHRRINWCDQMDLLKKAHDRTTARQ
jgi:hypothetical protein